MKWSDYLQDVANRKESVEGFQGEKPLSTGEREALLLVFPTQYETLTFSQAGAPPIFRSRKTLATQFQSIYNKFAIDPATPAELAKLLRIGFEKLKQKELQQEQAITTIPTYSSTPPQPRQLFGNANHPIPNWLGRDELLTELHTELQNNRRVLVLCGQGGIGKTSLVVKLMAACGVDVSKSLLPANCPYENVLFYQVGESDSFESLVARFFDAFGLAPNSDRTPSQQIESIVQRLHQQRWLVVLDNLESLMEFDSAKSKSADVGNLLNALAYGGHNSQIVITSRKLPEDLYDRRGRGFNPGVVCEYKIPGISVAASIQLLKELGARDSQADLEWIAGRVDGNVFILGQLANYSKNKPGLLRKQPHLVTDKAKPIVQTQWELQGTLARDLLQRMCVLRMGMNAEALTLLRFVQPNGEVMECTPEAKAATEDLLSRLVNSDLLQDRYDESVCESRYILHPLMAETLREIFEADLKLLCRYAAGLYGSLDRPKEFRSPDDLKFVLEELHFYWLSQNYYYLMMIANDVIPMLRAWCCWNLEEMWLNRILKVYILLNDRANMGKFFFCLGDVVRKLGDYNRAEALYNEALEIFTALSDDRLRLAMCWGCLGDIARLRGDYDLAETHYDRVLKVRTELDDRVGMGTSWAVLGHIARLRGDYDRAETYHKQSFAISCEFGDLAGMSKSAIDLGNIARHRSDNDLAETLYKKSLIIEEFLRNRATMGLAWLGLGGNELDRGNLETAETWLQQALTVFAELQMPDRLAVLNWDFARLYRAKGDEPQAQTHYSISHGLYTKLGAKKELEKIESVWSADR